MNLHAHSISTPLATPCIHSLSYPASVCAQNYTHYMIHDNSIQISGDNQVRDTYNSIPIAPHKHENKTRKKTTPVPFTPLLTHFSVRVLFSSYQARQQPLYIFSLSVVANLCAAFISHAPRQCACTRQVRKLCLPRCPRHTTLTLPMHVLQTTTVLHCPFYTAIPTKYRRI